MLRAWNDLPDYMRTLEVKPYYDILKKRAWQFILKRLFDLVLAIILLIILFIPMIIIGLWICMDSKGGPIFRQERVTTYGRRFKIHKFRTMVKNSGQKGPQLTTNADLRVTRAGTFLRRFHLDEMPQLLDVLEGTMSFVGTRPEVSVYVEKYKPEYYATLLMPAGITSEATIQYKDESQLLDAADDYERVYLDIILPEKMRLNLDAIKHFSLMQEAKTIIRTIMAILR